MTIKALRIINETTVSGTPNVTVERFIKDALAEYDVLVKANTVLSNHNDLLQKQASDTTSAIDDLNEDGFVDGTFRKLLIALGENP